MRLSGLNIGALKIGSVTALRAYQGTDLVYDSGSVITDPVLKVIVNGIDGEYEVAVNNVVWENNEKSFPYGTVLENLVVSVEDYDIEPAVIDIVILNNNHTLTFSGTSQGFSHVDVQWEAVNGGKLGNGVIRDGNNLLKGAGEDYYAVAGLTLTGNTEGSIKCNLNHGIIGYVPVGTFLDNRKDFAYGVFTEPEGPIYAIGWLDTPDQIYVRLGGQVRPELIQIDLTPTEVIWSYGEDRIEWCRAERKDFDYVLGAGVYELIENIKEKGFISSVDVPVEPEVEYLITGASRMVLPSDNWVKTDNKYVRNSGGGDFTGKIIPKDGLIAFQFKTPVAGGGALHFVNGENGFSGNYAGVRNRNGVIQFESTIDGNFQVGDLNPQPQKNNYVALRRINGNVGAYYTSNGITFSGMIRDYGPLDYTRIYCEGTDPDRVIYDPQIMIIEGGGEDEGNILLDGAVRFIPASPWVNVSGYTYYKLNSSVEMLHEVIEGDGYLATRFENDTKFLLYVSTTNDTSYSEGWLGLRFAGNGVISKEDRNTGEATVTPPPYGHYVGLRRVGDQIDAFSTLDGITFNVLYSWIQGVYDTDIKDHKYFITESNGNDNLMIDPQGVGLLSPFGRSWSINLANEYSDDVSDPNFTWNDYKPTADQLNTPNGLTLSNMLTETGEASTLSITNVTKLNGAGSGYVNYTSPTPVYPYVAVNSGISINGLSTFKIAGTDPAKLYNLSILSVSDDNNSATSVAYGSQVLEKVSSANYPVDGENRYINSSLMRLSNISPNQDGAFEINIDSVGGFYQTVINLILIQEQ